MTTAHIYQDVDHVNMHDPKNSDCKMISKQEKYPGYLGCSRGIFYRFSKAYRRLKKIPNP